MIGGIARRAAVIGFRSGVQSGLRTAVLLGVRLQRAAGTAAREGRRVAGLNGGVVAMIVGIEAVIAAVIAARGRTGAGDRGRNSRVEIDSRGSTGTSGPRSLRRTG
ncbi:MAG: hypothetical protein QOH06_5241 [Acidobacteriota bacterium]|jgi:hypothetical protein|nr:hypothetical protein [Acidobacteriota bacterium]